MSKLDVEKFFESPVLPENLEVPLQALWYAERGEWVQAHELVQDDESRNGAWVHAHLHRVEGDIGNAGYWYRRAQRQIGNGTVEAERREIATACLANSR